MSKQRRTADDFVRDMKAKQQHSTPGDIERKTSEGQSEVPLTPEQAEQAQQEVEAVITDTLTRRSK
jgi:hypothetical protein